MKSLYAGPRLLFLISLVALLISFNHLRTASAAGTTLGDLAAAMQPGTWAAMPQTNIDAVLAHGTYIGNILPFAMSSKWDSIGRRLYYLGGDHGEQASWHVYYDEATNSWVDLGLTNFPMVYGYDHIAIDTSARHLYFNPYNESNIYRYPIASNGPWNLLSEYTPSGYLAVTHGVDMFDGPFNGTAAPNVLAIYNCGATGGEIAIYDPAANRWLAGLTGFGGSAGYHCFLEYSKVHNVALLGGGSANGRSVWRLNADRTVTTMPDSPVEVGIQRANVVADPVTGNFLILGYGQLWELDPRGAGSWRLQTGSRTPPSAVGNPGFPDIDGVISAALSNHGAVAYTTCRARSCNMYLYKHATSPAPPPDTPPGTGSPPGGGGTGGTTEATGYGLEWPGDGAVRRMLYWHNPFPIYDATYIFKVYPRKKTTGAYRYYTTFFWGNDGSFIWDGGNGNTYYGAHPYPVPAPSGPGQWEISVYSNDYVTGSEVQWNRWYTQAFRAWRESPSITHHEFYWDLPDTSKVISKTIVSSSWANQDPPTPSIQIGQSAWQYYAGDEEFNGIIRGIQIYSGLLSVAAVPSEIAAPKSTAAGQSFIWYLNLNPRPSDVTDKKGIGTPHNPSWRGTTALEWIDQTAPPPPPPPPPAPLVISAVSATNVTTTSATIIWTTNELADSQVDYGTTTAYGQTTPLNSLLVTAHSVSLSALAAGTTYHFRVRSRDAASNSASSSDFTFTTAGAGTIYAGYGFNEGAGSVAADSSSNGFSGTLVNGPVWTTGHSASALSFDGVNDKVSLPSTLDVSSLPLTLEAWIMPTSRADWRAIFSKRSSYGASAMRFDVGLSITAGRVYITTAQSFVTFTYAPPLNAWTHIAIVAQSSGTKLYVNGVLSETLTSITLGTQASAPVTVGNTGDNDDPFAGIIDDLRLYHRALSATEIQSDMNSGL